VLAAGAYVVVPPSQSREWLTSGFLEAVEPLPERWKEFLASRRRKSLHEELTIAEQTGVGDLRNVTLAALVGRWLTRGCSEREAREKARAWTRKVPQLPPFTEAEAEAVVSSIIRTRKRARSPEREAIALARVRRLKQPAQAVLVALVAMWGELGLTEPVLAAPHRMVASFAQVDADSVGPALRTLASAGLVHLGHGRDPNGRRVTVVRLRLAVGG
jgi:hypothetical protein